MTIFFRYLPLDCYFFSPISATIFSPYPPPATFDLNPLLYDTVLGSYDSYLFVYTRAVLTITGFCTSDYIFPFELVDEPEPHHEDMRRTEEIVSKRLRSGVKIAANSIFLR